MPETTEIRRAHQWTPPKRDNPRALRICRVCGAVKVPGRVSWCYSEEVAAEDA